MGTELPAGWTTETERVDGLRIVSDETAGRFGIAAPGADPEWRCTCCGLPFDSLRYARTFADRAHPVLRVS